MAPPSLCLASSSPYRAGLLRRLGLPFSVADPGVDESDLAGESPMVRARRLARLKAEAVADRSAAGIVIGSDQVAVLGDELLHKPGDTRRCEQQLLSCSGGSVRFLTAVALICREPRSMEQHLDETLVRFRMLTPAEVARYVELEKPFDCAGGFRVEGLGISLFEQIDTEDPTALIGLPMIWLAGALRRAGLDPLNAASGD